MKVFLNLAILMLVTSCAHRGWELSEQIEGVDNKLKRVESKSLQQNNSLIYKDDGETREIASGSSFYNFFIAKGQRTRTSMGEEGIVLNPF